MIHNKNDLRVKYREIRKKSQNSQKDKMIADILMKSNALKKADTVFLYSSLGSEVDTSFVIKRSIEMGKKVALPLCLDKEGNMNFYLITDIDKCLRKGSFSIYEPDINICPQADFTEKSLCVVPGLAFDKRGYRLGYGKGYYDRFLSRFKGSAIGLCYSECLCEELPFDRYDRKVNAIITEMEFLDLSKEEYIYG